MEAKTNYSLIFVFYFVSFRSYLSIYYFRYIFFVFFFIEFILYFSLLGIKVIGRAHENHNTSKHRKSAHNHTTSEHKRQQTLILCA